MMKKIQWKEGLSDEELSKYTIKSIVLSERNKTEAMREATRKRNKTKKFRDTIRKSRIGKKHSIESKRIMSEKRKGVPRSAKSIQMQIERQTDDASWSVGFNHLKVYIKQYKNSLIPARYITKCNFKLGIWVTTQRSRYYKNKLNTDRIKMLNSVNFIWDANEYSWDMAFSYLVTYKKDNGDCLVPQRYICSNGYALGMWAANERKKFKLYNSNKTKYSKRITSFKKIGFKLNSK